MRIRNNKLKLLVIVLVLFACSFFVNIKESYAIYKSTLTTTVSLSVLDPSTNFVVTLALNDGSGTTTTVNKTYNEQMGSDLYTPTRTNYNFMGWYDENNHRVYASEHVTGNVTYHAEWKKIVCKRVTNVNNLNTETCNPSNNSGCATDSIYSKNTTITYGSIYGVESVFGQNSPKAGDAFDCDVYYSSNEDTFDETDGNGKHIERFYFVREKENNGSENTAVLIYYTVFDGTGRVDSQNTSDSKHYDMASGWLPTASNNIASATWNNPGLVDFDGNGQISRFLSRADFESICGPFTLGTSPDTSAAKTYMENCFGGSDVNNKNWFLFENSRFQSNNKGRAGVWLETDGTNYYRIQTGSLNVNHWSNGTSSDNTAKPVIEIPISALDGFVNEIRYTVSFVTHGGTAVGDIYRYEGEALGTITTTREHYNFDGWYATYENDTYSNPVNASTHITSDMTLYAKWTAKPACAVTLHLNGGTGVDTSAIVDIGDTYDPGTPTKTDSTFLGWYTDVDTTVPYDATTPISTSVLSLYAKWTSANYVATVEGVGSYETLKDAFANVPTTGTKTKVTLLQNISITADTECAAVLSTQNIDFDLGGYTITGTNTVTSNLIYINKGGTLEISNGTVNNAGSKAILYVEGASNGKGTLYIKDGTTGLHLNMTGNYAAVANKGNTYMSSGEITASNQPAAVNTGTDGDYKNASAIFVMTGGRITTTGAKKNQAIYNDGGARVEISGDSYLYSQSSNSSFLRATVTNNNGTVIITGGTIVSKNFSAVTTATGSVTVGDDDGIVDITAPVLRGKIYGLEGTTASVYDGIFESLNNTSAVSVTNITKPYNFYNSTIDVDGDTYHSTYLFVPDFTVTFYPENGDNSIEKIINNGSTIGSDMPSNPTKTGYYFDGWYENNTEITSSTQPNHNINAYARWVQSISNATISSTLSVEKESSETISITGTDIEGATFSSSDDTVATVDANGEVTGVNVGTATITITGIRSGDTRTVTVTVTPIMRTVRFFKFDDDETPIDTRTVFDGTTLNGNMPSNPTDTNYIFDNWKIKDAVGEFTSAVTITGDVDVVGVWTPNIRHATIPSTLIVGVGNTKTISVTGPSGMESYTFATEDSTYATVNSTTGAVQGEELGVVNINVIGSRSNVVIPVEVTVVSPTHDITFYDDEGGNVIDTITVNEGATIATTQDVSMPNNPTKQGYLFDGWIYDDGTSLTPFTSATEVHGDVDVIAVWKEPISTATIASTITVRHGGSEVITFTPSSTYSVEDFTVVSSDSNTVEVSNHTVYGTSIGTATLTITGSLSGATKTVTVNVTDKYAVVFKDDDDNVLETIYVTEGDSIDETEGATLPADQTKSGYTFDNWYIYNGTEVTTTRLDTSAAVNSDLVYKPRWAGSNMVAAIGTTYYTTIANAITAVPSGTETEIRILQDIDNISGRTTVPSGKNVVISGGSHTVSCGSSTSNNVLYNNGGTLRIKSGTFECMSTGRSGIAPLENSSGGTMYIEGGTVRNGNNRGAVWNSGTLYVTGGELYTESNVKGRSVIQNNNAARLIMSGGTVTQYATSYTTDGSSNGQGAIKAVSGAIVTITGGTVISKSTNSGAIYNAGTLTIGIDHQDNTYDITTPVIQGEQYGIESSANYSVYDGIIKSKTESSVVNDPEKITGTETGTTLQTGTEDGYYTLYYTVPQQVQYRINLNANGGTFSGDNYVDFDLGDTVVLSDLPEPTKGIYTFDGWYTDSEALTSPVTFPYTVPSVAGNTTFYAKWTYASSLTPVNHIVTSDAMTYYFTNISSWASADSQIAVNQDASLDNDNHTTYLTNMRSNFTSNSCSECEGNNNNSINPTQNSCNSPTTGTYCDLPKGYDTGVGAALNVYLTSNGTKTGNPLDYIEASDGVIYNMIPGVTYYWELQSDANVYGVVSATKNSTNYRRTLKTSIRNLRDLGGMSVSYTENGVTTNGTIDYGRLYRGAQNANGSTGIAELQALGITREIDLRATGDGNTSQTKFPTSNYDVSNSDSLYTRFNNKTNDKNLTDGYKDVKITNYFINPVANSYFQDEHEDNYKDLKQAMKAIMRQIVNHEVVYFHCTIGTDRTGTIAYFLEGLLGVSNEDRLRDYEMTYFFGLTNRSRFHNNLSGSSINPRFYAMYKSYPNVSDIEDFYFNYFQESDDESLLHDFRAELIH